MRGNGNSHHGLIDGIGGLVREDAGGEAGDHLLHPRLVGRVQDIVVDVDVCPLGKGRFIRIVGSGIPKSLHQHLLNNSRKLWFGSGNRASHIPVCPISQFREHSIPRDLDSAHSVGAHPKIQVGADVFEEASDHGSQVDDVGGLVPLKQGFCLRAAPGMGDFGDSVGSAEQIGVFLRENPILGGEVLGFGGGRLGGF